MGEEWDGHLVVGAALLHTPSNIPSHTHGHTPLAFAVLALIWAVAALTALEEETMCRGG